MPGDLLAPLDKSFLALLMAHIMRQWYKVNALLRVDSQTRAQFNAHVFTRMILCHDVSRIQNAICLATLVTLAR